MRNILIPYSIKESEIYGLVAVRALIVSIIRPLSYLPAKVELAIGPAKRRAFIEPKQDPIKNIICYPE